MIITIYTHKTSKTSQNNMKTFFDCWEHFYTFTYWPFLDLTQVVSGYYSHDIALLATKSGDNCALYWLSRNLCGYGQSLAGPIGEAAGGGPQGLGGRMASSHMGEESVCKVSLKTRSLATGKAATMFDEQDARLNDALIGHVFDIKEDCFSELSNSNLMAMKSLNYTSKTRNQESRSDVTSDARSASDGKRVGNTTSASRAETAATLQNYPTYFSPALVPAQAEPKADAEDDSSQSRLQATLLPTSSSHLVLLDELTMQALPARQSSRELLCLTSNGLIVVTKRTPMDILLDRAGQGNDRLWLQQDVAKCMRRYGAVETAAMVLQAYCLGTEPPTLSIQNLESVLMDGQFRTVSVPTQVEGTPPMSPTVAALYLVGGRLLRPIWQRPVAQSGRLALCLQGTIRKCIRSRLQTIVSLMHSTRPYADFTGDNCIGVVDGDGQKIRNMWLLLTKCLQALDLLRILQESLDESFPWTQFEGTTFRSLVASEPAGDKVTQALQEVAVRIHKAAEMKVFASELVAVLGQTCHRYFSVGDYCETLAKFHIFDLQQASASALAFGHYPPDDITNLVDNIMKATSQWGYEFHVINTGDRQAVLTAFCHELTSLVPRDPLLLYLIVHMCLATAENFGAPPRKVRREENRGQGEEGKGVDQYAELFKSRTDTPRMMAPALTSEQLTRARRACYNSLSEAIERVGPADDSDIFLRFVLEAWSASEDGEWRENLCGCIHRTSKNILLRIPLDAAVDVGVGVDAGYGVGGGDSQEYTVVDFLKNIGDHDLVYR